MTAIAAVRRARSLPAARDLAARHLVQVEGTAQFGVAADAVFGRARLQQGEVPRGALCKSFREWLRPRLGTGPAFVLIGAYLAGLLVRNWFTRTLHWLEEYRSVPTLTVLGGFTSLLVAVTAAACREGAAAVPQIFRPGGVVRFLPVAALCAINLPCVPIAVHAFHAPIGAAFILGQLALPLSAVVGHVVMRRRYGTLESLSIAIMTLACPTLLALRIRALDDGTPRQRTASEIAGGLGMILLMVVTGVLWLTYAERAVKNNSAPRHGIVEGVQEPGRFSKICICKGQLDVAILIIGCSCWAVQHLALGESAWSSFESVTSTDVLVMCSRVLNGWLSLLVVSYFSTVASLIVEMISFNLSIIVIDPLRGDGAFFSGQAVGALLFAITFLSALVYQTGRLIIADLQASLGASSAAIGPPSPGALGSASPRWPRCRGLCRAVVRNSSIIIFVLSDAARQLTQATVLGGLMLTPQTFVFVTYAVGVLVALVTTAAASDSVPACLGDLRHGLHPWNSIRYLPCGFLFGVSSILTAMAYSYGITASLNTAIGYIYTPFSALASALVLGKYYMWLEWFALGILSCALVIYGLLSTYFAGTDAGSSSIVGAVCVVGSAVASVLASLVSEKLMKEESRPFHVQKIGLDLGSAACVLLSMPVVGFLEEDPKYAFWKPRPLDRSCGDGACWRAGGGCGSDGCNCPCGAGFFAAWDSWWIVAALAVNVLQGWMTGVVIKRFSTVSRALAQSFTLVVIYFVGDPLLSTGAPHSLTLTLVTFIIPLSSAVFGCAVSEMESIASRQDSMGFPLATDTGEVSATSIQAAAGTSEAASRSWLPPVAPLARCRSV